MQRHANHIGDIYLYILQFTDHQVIIANCKVDLEYIARNRKTKCSPIEEPSNIELENDKVESFNMYTYVEKIFDRTGSDDKDMANRITLALCRAEGLIKDEKYI